MRGRGRLFATALIAGVFTVATGLPAGAVAPLPSGEVTFGQTVVEPAYNDVTGTLLYLSTPKHAHVNPNFAHSVAPIYLPMYPAGAQVGTLNCQDIPTENCPDHGALVAGIAAQANSLVYGDGVEGHDHLVAPPGHVEDFNINWIPILVLFNTPDVVTHITTIAQIRALEAANAVTEIPLPPATFHCSVVPAAVYNNGVPYQL